MLRYILNIYYIQYAIKTMKICFPFSIQDAFRSADMVDWTVGGAVAGQVKAGGGLTFLAVEGAGHMVPMDQPANVRTPIITIIL